MPYGQTAHVLPKAPFTPGKVSECYPVEQFHIAPPDRCDAPHWHAARDVFSIGTVGALEAVVCHDGYQFQPKSDPDPGGCGFGRVTEVVRLDMVVSAACWANWLARH